MIWYKPVNPGVNPEKDTGAVMPPIFAVAWSGEVGCNTVEEAGLPVTMGPVTGPRPVAYTIMVSLAAAGLELLTRLPSTWVIAAWVGESTNTPGANVFTRAV